MPAARGEGAAAVLRSEGEPKMGGDGRRSRVEPTNEWEQLAPLCRWRELLAYEEFRPLTLFGASVAERARETGSAERTLYRRVGRFEEEGIKSLFGQTARRRRLPPAMRRLVVDLNAGYPGFNPNEIANAVYVGGSYGNCQEPQSDKLTMHLRAAAALPC